jgi:polysaccharide deacetylase family protein (PEP-CTERM system associated)
MKNAISIDLEDWHHNIVADYTTWPDYEDRVVCSSAIVLKLLRDAGVKATFFTMGYVAEHHPDLIAQIHAEGHEIECHGYYHQFVYHLTPDEFRADLCRTRQAIESITGRRPMGYRAPYFSITKESWWALDVLAELGFRYDSSVFPVHNHRYGVPDAPRFAYQAETNRKGKLLELPSSTVHWGINWPVGGGVYFRFLPYPLIKKAVQQINREGNPALLYVHPWEMDPKQPVLKGLNPLFKARRYLNLDKTESKWRALLADFDFAPISEVFHQEIHGEAYA